MTLHSYSETTTTAGEANAAEARVEMSAPEVDIYYDVSADGDIVIEVRTPGSGGDWVPFDTVDTTGNREDVVELSTVASAVRAYADGNDFADGDVTSIEVIYRGEA